MKACTEHAAAWGPASPGLHPRSTSTLSASLRLSTSHVPTSPPAPVPVAAAGLASQHGTASTVNVSRTVYHGPGPL